MNLGNDKKVDLAKLQTADDNLVVTIMHMLLLHNVKTVYAYIC